MSLDCSATSLLPSLTLYWSPNDRWSGMKGNASPNSRQVGGTFDAVKLSDAGEYTCIAENIAGRSEKRLQLVVEPAGGGERRQAAAGRPAAFVPPPPPAAGVPGRVRTDQNLYVVPLNGRAELTCLVEGGYSAQTERTGNGCSDWSCHHHTFNI